MEVNYEKLLQHSNEMKNHIKEISDLDPAVLNWKEKEDKWSVIEVIGHLNKVFDIYLDNFREAIESAPQLNGNEEAPMQRTLLGRLSIYSNKPKERKRKFKMKTFSFFQPAHDQEKTEATIKEFLDNKEQFNELIRQARLKNLKGVKVPTALGNKVRFYIPECFEFILAHEERHMVQIDDVLSQQK